MSAFLIRHLLLSSLVLSLAACSRKMASEGNACGQGSHDIASLKPRFNSVLFQAFADVMGRHMSGLLMYKNMGNDTVRVVFTSETGITLFDFEYGPGQFKVLQINSSLRKKAVINRLRDDLGLPLLFDLKTENTVCYFCGKDHCIYTSRKSESVVLKTNSVNNKIIQAETYKGKHKKTVITFSGYINGLADSMHISHQAFSYSIALKQINR